MSRESIASRPLLAELGRSPTRLERVLYAPAAPDWVLSIYFFTVVVGLSRAHTSPARDSYLLLIGGVLATYLAAVYAFRRLESRPGYRPSYLLLLAYHCLPLGALMFVFFNLRPILPIINPLALDDQLYRLDLTIFGFEPTLAVERFSTPAVVEWFSFFYYSYFYFLSAFVFVMLISCASDERLCHFATGILLVVGIGHYVYTVVPGYGPYDYLAHEYQRPLEGGPFYRLVINAVSAAGAYKDIFPSLHTAVPTFCTLFAWKHYRRVAPIATFFVVNIIIATVVLRWHYATDLCAGLALAVFAHLVAPRLVERYQVRRAALGLADRRW